MKINNNKRARIHPMGVFLMIEMYKFVSELTKNKRDLHQNKS